ncbi:uncharacterized protein LOC128986869 [Macrosteles quadrilineatus]|uniref:uncharacterized protein LOC128986869 n=1 Tax=Macrosteles quadrilineatus TaxID=74068 RepID=UPI0023E1F267|nr:uncharacterized protein LOC128986869 [Macrosteles quadrilineatus]
MGKALGIDHLPLEVLEVLITFLSANDLTNCIGVSQTWYSIFSNDLFWKRHCIGSSNDYFSTTKCLVEPGFELKNDTVLPIQENRLRFLQEQHLLKNWRCGRFKKEEIEFDCDDSISYNINVSFLDNDHVCLHLTYETQVWNLADTPVLVLTIPYCLSELWEANIYKIVNGNLIVVIQCNVVQVYKICLDSKSWVLYHVFFFDKPEDFSRSLTADSDVDSIFVSTCSDFSEVNCECVVCGQYMIGAYINGESPLLHIWDIKTGKKVKEDKYEVGQIQYITFKSTKQVTDKVLVTYKLKNVTNIGGNVGRWSSIIYDTSLLQFILPSRFVHNGSVLYFDGHLSVIDDTPIKIVHHHDAMHQNETMTEPSKSLPDYVKYVTSVKPLGSNLLISTKQQIYIVNTVNLETCNLMKADFRLDHIEVLAGRFVLLHEIDYKSIKEVWEIGKSCRKVLEFPEDSGTYVASNSVCSKAVLEQGNKLIVLNFW